jgi:hypothetical protein
MTLALWDRVPEASMVNGQAQMTDYDRAEMSLDFVNDLVQDFQLRNAQFDLIDQVIFLQQRVEIPENFKKTAVEVRSPLPMHIANNITAAMSVNAPKVIFKSIEFGDPGDEEAAYRGRFFESSWLRQQREKKRPLHRLFMHSVVTKGEGILKTIPRKNRAWAKYKDFSLKALEEMEAAVERGDIDRNSAVRVWDAKTEQFKRGAPYPIETTDIPPETFYYQRGEDGFTRIAEIKNVPFYETLVKYNCALNPNGKVIWDNVTGLAIPPNEWGHAFDGSSGNRRTIQMIEMWDAQECQIILRGPGDFSPAGSGNRGSGLLVDRFPHKFGVPELGTLRGPYFHASGIMTSSREPHRSSLSVLFAYLHLFPLLNSLLTMQSQAAFSTSYPAYRRTTPPLVGMPESPFGFDAVEINQSRERIVPGAIFPHDIAPMEQPRASIDLDKAIGFVRSMIDMALPDTIQGVITGETAGYTVNQAAHLASLQWTPIVSNVQETLSDRTGFESELIESHVGETVYVWGAVPQPRKQPGQLRQYKDGWIAMAPKDLKGYHNYEVKLEPAILDNQEIKLRIIKQKLDMRLITPADAIREIGGNPVEVERGWMLYEIKQDPEVRKNLKQRIFSRLGSLEQQEMSQLPAAMMPNAAPVPQFQQPAGATPGVSQGLPATGFVPPQGAVPNAPIPPPPGGPPITNLPPGTASGQPGGTRNAPPQHMPLPGQG